MLPRPAPTHREPRIGATLPPGYIEAPGSELLARLFGVSATAAERTSDPVAV